MNLASMLLRAAGTSPDAAAVVTAGARLGFGELGARVARAAAGLADRVEPGARVAILAGNDDAFVTAYLATLASGAVAVPLNPTSPAHEIARELQTIAASLVLVGPATGDLARRARAPAVPFRELLGGDGRAAPVTRAADDLAALLFTAGTAGPPKPAMLTHGSLLANLEQMQSHPGLRLGPQDVALGVVPLFHVYGLNVVLGLALLAGAAVSLVEHFHPVETLARIVDDGVTVVAAVPAIYSAWLALDDPPRDAFATVRLCVSGAASLPRAVVEGMRERFGAVVHDGYGLTEASPVVTTSAVSRQPRPGSVGPPLPGIELRLVDADGGPALEGDPGEILVRGPNVFAGYWGDADATGRVLSPDGWLRTGDVGVADADGWLTLVDRAKDMIVVSGFNVYPGEVEAVLADHPDVAEVAVVGEAHPRTGEAVVAYVVARPGRRPDPVELVRHAGRRLARYKLPTRVDVVDALPRTLAGKVVRRMLGRGATDATTNPT